MTVFFTADTHFGDHRTINIQRRPFATVAEMDAILIPAHRATKSEARLVGVSDIYICAVDRQHALMIAVESSKGAIDIRVRLDDGIDPYFKRFALDNNLARIAIAICFNCARRVGHAMPLQAEHIFSAEFH
jgi:hypothetical protein